MIFAAGLGTRLKPITDNMPKALVPVGGKPLIRILLDKLVRYGYDDVVVNVHHFADMLESYLAEAAAELGIRIRISDERDLLRETGGGLKYAEPLLRHSGGRILVHNADILSDLDFNAFESSVPADALAALAVSRRQTSRYLLFDDGMKLAGWTNTDTGEVKSPFADIDVPKCRKFAFSGIHSISEKAFDLFRDEGFGDKFSIVDFYLKTADRYPVYGIAPSDFRILDVGKISSLSVAEDFYEYDNKKDCCKV